MKISVKSNKERKFQSIVQLRKKRQEEKKRHLNEEQKIFYTDDKTLDTTDDNKEEEEVKNTSNVLMNSDNTTFNIEQEEKRQEEDEEKLDPTYEEEEEIVHEEVMDVLPEIKLALEVAGLYKFHISSTGGSMTPAGANENVRRTSIYLSWTFAFHHKIEEADDHRQQQPKLSASNCFSWWKELLTEHYQLLDSFCTIHLEKNKFYKGSTLNNYMIDIQKSAHWFVFIRLDRKENNFVDPSYLTTFKTVVAGMKKNIKLTIKKERANSNNNHSLESMVYDLKLPVNGIKDLQNAIKDDLPLAESLAMNASTIDNAMYNMFLSILFSSMYCFNAQGRISGIF
jgi:hypothetical protein